MGRCDAYLRLWQRIFAVQHLGTGPERDSPQTTWKVGRMAAHQQGSSLSLGLIFPFCRFLPYKYFMVFNIHTNGPC